MVTVTTGDLEIGLGIAELAEAVLAQYSLGAMILRNGACLDPVQTEFSESDVDRLPDGRSGASASTQVLGQPVAHDCGLERAPRDRQGYPPGSDPGIVGDDQAVQLSCGLQAQALRHQFGLMVHGEVGVRSHGFPRRHELSIAREGIGEWFGIGLLQKANKGAHKGNCLRLRTVECSGTGRLSRLRVGGVLFDLTAVPADAIEGEPRCG